MPKLLSQWRIFLGLWIAISATGCGTIISRFDPKGLATPDHPLPRVYSGIRTDFRGFWHPDKPGTNNVEGFFLVDIPLSFCADTLILPLTIYEQYQYGSYGVHQTTQQNKKSE